MGADLKVQWRIFLGLALFIAVIGAIYWFVSYEDAGTTLLALASGLALMCGGYLLVQDRRKTPATAAGHEPQYLPTRACGPSASASACSWPSTASSSARRGLCPAP